MLAKDFTQPALRAIALHGVAHGDARGNHANARAGIRGVASACFGGAAHHPKRKGAAVEAAPLLPRMLEISLAPEALLGAETHGGV